MDWKLPTGVLCAYGFFKEMKPSEPFLTPYLNSSFKNFTIGELNSEVYPIWTYSYLVALFFVFLLTDFLRYKPLIVLESLAYLSTRALLIWGNTILAMQFMQIAYGIATGTEIAYYSYVYAMVSKEHYQRVTGYTRGVVLFGRAAAGILGQLLISLKVTNFLVLNYISLSSVSISVLIALMLPRVRGAIFNVNFEDASPTSDSGSDPPVQGNKRTKFMANLKVLLGSFKGSYSNTLLLRWSVWWALAMCGYLQVGNYVQSLWKEVEGKSNKSFNGAVEAVGTLAGSLVAFILSMVHTQWGVITDVLVGIVSLVDFTLLLLMAWTGSIWIAYVTYIGYRMSFTLLITIASFQVACHVKLSGYGLIFGANTFLALCLQSLLTVIVADKRGLDLDIRTQFVVYSVYYGCIGVIFLVKPIYHMLMKIRLLCVRRRRNYRHFNDSVDSLEQSATDNECINNEPFDATVRPPSKDSRVV